MTRIATIALITGGIAVGTLAIAYIAGTTEAKLTRCKDEGRVLIAKFMEALPQELAKKPSSKEEEIGLAAQAVVQSMVNAVGPAFFEQHRFKWQGAEGLAQCLEWLERTRREIAEFKAGKP